ncbi:Uncharacterised protein [Bordetella pertussis]|nr:Uncharacterised protein [Bordetella pertussis]CFO21976.1 Uncharacterised protein [Bordetella pertussis]CFV99700.1 Uncharacterised protein [Bordetella pertussis]CPI88626.1 Uncharacterised protein [Bordetella pertussis]CPL81129.1 Uncharacterised protein [Bordetella pertussis]
MMATLPPGSRPAARNPSATWQARRQYVAQSIGCQMP